jgi:exodeoxyribonuclease VII large subunit
MRINQSLKVESVIEEKVFTVSEFLDFLNRILTPQEVVVQGEIGKKIDSRPNYSIFNLLDKKDGSVLKCFIWQNKLENLGINLKDGIEVKVFGHPKIYKSQYGSEFEFEVEQIWLIGEGILKQAFEVLKRKLEKEGLFRLEFKKSIPRFCQKIGLITSKYGKGAKPDFEKHLGKFGFEIYFYDVRVEGIFAISEITEAIHWFNEEGADLDVLVLIRGGGDWESLQAFNSEPVARAIFASKIPIICGVGHESDITIADLVADLRASTPTDAAKILNENWKLAAINIPQIERSFNVSIGKIFKGVKEKIVFFKSNLTTEVKKEISLKQKELENLWRDLNLRFQSYFKEFEILEREFKKNFIKIASLIKNQKLKFEQFLKNLIKNRIWWQEKIEKLLKQQEEKLVLSSPILKLKQGYTITSDELGKIVKDPTKLKISQTIKTKFYKGQVLSRVKKIE